LPPWNALAKKRRLIKCATISKKFTSTFSTFKNIVEIITANMVKGENGKNTKDAFTIFALPSKTYILQGCTILQRSLRKRPCTCIKRLINITTHIIMTMDDTIGIKT